MKPIDVEEAARSSPGSFETKQDLVLQSSLVGDLYPF